MELVVSSSENMDLPTLYAIVEEFILVHISGQSAEASIGDKERTLTHKNTNLCILVNYVLEVGCHHNHQHCSP